MQEFIPPQIDFAILTAKIEEFDAVRQRIGPTIDWQGTRSDPNEFNWTLGTIARPGSERPYRVVLAFSHVQTIVPATRMAEKTIERFNPSCVVFVGIGGALIDDLDYGDVVVGERVWQPNFREMDTPIPRQKFRWDLADSLLPSLADFAYRNGGWRDSLGARPDGIDIKPKVVFKGILSGDDVIENINTPRMTAVLQYDPDLGIVETEAAGVAAAVKAEKIRRNLELIVIRGASDRPGAPREAQAGVPPTQNRLDRKAWTEYAANAAAAFTVSYIAEKFPYPPLSGSQVLILGRDAEQPRFRVIRASERTRMTAVGTEKPRMLAIIGKAGRGKSYFARTQRDKLVAAEPNSLHFWLNCNYYEPDRSSFFQLFNQHPAFRAASLDPADTSVSVLLSALDNLSDHVYVYLDDMDRADVRMFRYFTFFSQFLQAWRDREESRLRIIATVKDPEFLSEVQGELGYGLTFERIELKQLSAQQSHNYFSDAGIADLLDEDDLHKAIRLCGGEPLVMTLLVEQCMKEHDDHAKKRVLQAIMGKAERLEGEGKPSSEAMTEEVYRERVNKIRQYAGNSGSHADRVNADYRVLVALAVLYPEYGNADVLDDDLVRSVATRVQSNLPPIDEHGYQSARQHLNLEMLAGMSFKADTARSVIYSDLARDEPDLLSDLHREAAEAFIKRGHPDYAGWHYSKAGLVDQAFLQVELAAPELAAIYNWKSLGALYNELDRSIGAVLSAARKRGAIGVPAHGYDEVQLQNLHVANQANIAEMLYQNEAEKWETEYQRIISAISVGIEERMHGAESAYIQVRALKTMYDFEMLGGDWHRLVAETAQLIDKAVELSNSAIEANLRTNQGVYYNRGFQTASALAEYDRALKLLEPLRGRWKPGSHESEHLEQDLLRVAVNRSRSVFLSSAPVGGPRDAIAALTAEMSKVVRAADAASLWKDGSSMERDRRRYLEYTYGAVNLCFYNLCQNEIGLASEWLSRCFKNGVYSQPDSPTWTEEIWIIECARAMRAALMVYDESNYDGALEQFERSAKAFEKMEVPRDKGFMMLNSVSTKACRWLESAGTLTHSQYEEAMTSLDRIDPSVLSEPIAGNVEAYLRWRLAPSDYPNRPEIDQKVKAWVEEHMGLLMETPGSGTESLKTKDERAGARGRLQKSAWVPPMILRGALVLRAKPLAPVYEAVTATGGI